MEAIIDEIKKRGGFIYIPPERPPSPPPPRRNYDSISSTIRRPLLDRPVETPETCKSACLDFLCSRAGCLCFSGALLIAGVITGICVMGSYAFGDYCSEDNLSLPGRGATCAILAVAFELIMAAIGMALCVCLIVCLCKRCE